MGTNVRFEVRFNLRYSAKSGMVTNFVLDALNEVFTVKLYKSYIILIIEGLFLS